MLDIDAGKATNRTVITFVGAPDVVIEAAFLLIKRASELIDMSKHSGEHPRFGATDVCPLVPISNISLEETATYAHKLGERVGKELGIKPEILGRHPFPGPGLAIRILGDITEEKVRILQEVDHIWIQGMRDAGLYDEVWQAGAILLPVQSVGVMGDERTYEQAVALRAVSSTDGMTADWCHLPYDFLAKISNDIINKVRGVNRVVYDISSKPPATIEWE